MRAERGRTDFGSGLPRGASPSRDTSPLLEPEFWIEHKTPAWRTRRLRPAEQTGTAQRRSEGTWAERRYRYKAWKPAPARRFEMHPPESPYAGHARLRD